MTNAMMQNDLADEKAVEAGLRKKVVALAEENAALKVLYLLTNFTAWLCAPTTSARMYFFWTEPAEHASA